jgi:Domain of unknown function (DUF1840)
MTQKVAERLLAIIGKAPGPTGIILPAQMPAAIQALEAAIAAEREHPQAEEAGTDTDDDRDPERSPAITLAQRAWPLIDMLRTAAAAEREITWGV